MLDITELTILVLFVIAITDIEFKIFQIKKG